MGGWGNDEIPVERPGSSAGRRMSFGRGSKSQKNATDVPADNQLQLKPGKMVTLEDNIDTIQSDIPTLQEVQNADDFGPSVAQAPSVSVNKVATFKELEENQILKSAAFASVDSDFDLGILAKTLCPEPDVRDEETPWTWDYLFTSVSSDLRREWDIRRQKADLNESQTQEILTS